jgi:sugar phosphate isomerase/epimerase
MAISLGLRIPDALGDLSITEVVAFAREAGLDVLDLRADFAPAAEACRAAGLGIGSVDGVVSGELISPDDATRERAVAAICDQIAAMAAAGARAMFLCLVPKDKAQPISRSLELFKESFPAVARACEAAGVRIAFEGYPGPEPYYPTLGYTPEVWRAMFEAVPSASLGLCYDPSHLVRLGIPYLRVLEEFKGRIHHCHGKDTALLPEAQYLYGRLYPALVEAPDHSGGAWRYCVPGSGIVDWSAVAYGLESADYQGCVSIELEDARFSGSVPNEQKGVRKALEHLALHFR